jgi:nitroimidazol reductase NimA-like FMN-containing flavoprotein (pyridoxamine 5'-phosphate oxidase superfamily)
MEGYGVPGHDKGMLRWPDVADQLAKARNYWVMTMRPDGRPHAVPVWGVWLDERLYFGTDRRSRKARNLASNPAMVIHLESGEEAVIVEGVAEEVTEAGRIAAIDKAYSPKYKMHLTDAPGELVIYALRPSVAFAWRERDFPRSSTRWRFGAEV